MLTEEDVRRIVREELKKAAIEPNTEMSQVERLAKQWADYIPIVAPTDAE